MIKMSQAISNHHAESAAVAIVSSYISQYCVTTINQSVIERWQNMMTSSNGNIFRVTGPLCGEFTGPRWIPRTQRPVTRSFDVFCDLRFNKRLSKQSWGWWFETLSRPLWRHRNEFSNSVDVFVLDVFVFSQEITRYRVCQNFSRGRNNEFMKRL